MIILNKGAVMKTFSTIGLSSLMISAAYSMDNVSKKDNEKKIKPEQEIIIEEDLELGGYRANLLTPETISQLGFLKKITLIM